MSTHFGDFRHTTRVAFGVATLVVMLALSTAAQARRPWPQVGVLSCKVAPNIGSVIVGHQPLDCTFTPSAATPAQEYDGAINTVGLNIGISAGSVLGWAVFAPTTGVPAGALAGDYIGVSGDIGIGVGAGANVLLGGSGRTFALQPLSFQGSIATNIILGVSALSLHWH